MRDRETIDSELRRLAALRRSIREQGGELSSRLVDDLLDERLGHRVGAVATEVVEAVEACPVMADTVPRDARTEEISPSRRMGVLRRFGFLAALPLSLLAIGAALAAMYALYHPRPAPLAPPSAPPAPPSAGRGDFAAPKTPAPPPDIIDRAFIDVLKHEGVPVPSHDYAIAHGHAVCDFVADQPSLTEAARFVQQSSIWDADQSTKFAGAAIASYCPRLEPAANLDQMQQTFQDVLSGLQSIEGDLHDIRDRLPVIAGGS